MLAAGWDTDYAQIEKSIRKVTFPDKKFVITKYGASTKAKAAKNQKAINKAIEACSKAGGGQIGNIAIVYLSTGKENNKKTQARA